jgi:hypothetical protein
MRDDSQDRATEFVKELYAAGDIDAGRPKPNSPGDGRLARRLT